MAPFKREIECTAYCSCGYCCNWEWGMMLPGPFYLGFSPSWLPVHLKHRKKGYIENKLPLFARYWTATSLTGSPYYGFTANGSVPAQKSLTTPGVKTNLFGGVFEALEATEDLEKGYLEPNCCWISYHISPCRVKPLLKARPAIFSRLSLMQYKKLPGRILLPWRIFPRHGTIAADTDFYPFGTRMFIPGYGWGEVEDKGSAIKGPGKIDLYYGSHTQALKWGRQKLQVLVVLPGQTTLDCLKIPRPIKDVLKGLNWLRCLIF